jgi:glucokinase
MTNAPDNIGLDIGGTTLKIVRVDTRGNVRAQITCPAGGLIPQDALFSIIDASVAQVGGLDGVAQVGIAVGGLVRADGTMPVGATNLPNLAEVPLQALFTERFHRPCHVQNDAHAALRGEAWIGSARGCENALMITFGTGIGGAVMLDGKIRRGAHGAAGEIGAWPLLGVADGISLEDFISPVRFERRTSRSLADALLRSDDADGRAARDVIGQAITSVHLLLDLELILIAGGLSAVGEPLREAIDQATRRACPPDMHHGLAVRLGALGSYAGAIGAVAPRAPGAPP